MNETIKPLKQEANTNPVHNLDDMVNWFALHRDKYPGYADVARSVREDLIKVASQVGATDGESQATRLELRPLAPDRDVDSVYYAEDPMPEGTYALISQLYRATDAESNKQEHLSTFDATAGDDDEAIGDSYTVYIATIGDKEVYLTEERTDKVTSLRVSAEAPRQSTEARIGHLVVTAS